MNRRRWGLAALVLLVAVTVGYVIYYHDRALPGTTVAGRYVDAMTVDQVAAVVAAQTNQSAVTLGVPGAELTRSAAQWGYTVDVEATAAAALAPNRTFWGYLAALVQDRAVPAVLQTDERLLDAGRQDLVAASGNGPQPAAVAVSADGTALTVQAPTPGLTIDPKTYREQLSAAASSLVRQKVTLETTTAAPTFTSADQARLTAQVDALANVEVSLSDGRNVTTANLADKAAWIEIPTVNGEVQAPVVVASAVRAWTDQVAASTATAVVNGVRVVDAEGHPMYWLERAHDGRAANNSYQLAKEATAALRAGTAFTGTFVYATVPAVWTEQVVANGAPVYQAAAGQKWIDINLSTHTLTAYVGSTVVRGPVAMVNGAPATPTVVGVFRIYKKLHLHTMRGFNADGTPYVTPDVPWISYFYSGYAIHGAPWRSSFGYTGSHGCINLPVSTARWVYEWAPMGTVVVTHR